MLRKFNQSGFAFDRIVSYKYSEGLCAEIYAILDNAAQMMFKVIPTLEITDINGHLVRMDKIRKYALKNGLFVSFVILSSRN